MLVWTRSLSKRVSFISRGLSLSAMDTSEADCKIQRTLKIMKQCQR